MVKKSVRNLGQNISLQRNGAESVSNLDQNISLKKKWLKKA